METRMPVAPRSSKSIAAALTCAALLLGGRTASAADPTKDQCIDANETAQSLRKGEKLREAEQKLLVCVSQSCPGPIRDDCAQRLTELRAVTPTIVFVVKDDADQDLSDVRVTMDDQVLTTKLDGTAVALNPGPHKFVFEAPGRTREERALVIREGEKDRHERVVLVAAAAPEPPPVAVAPVPAPAPTPDVPSTPGSGQRVAGLVVGGVGVAGLVVGGVFGMLAKSSWNDVGQLCPGYTGCHQDAFDKKSTANSQATVSTVAFIAGGVLVAGGVVLYLTAPRATVAVAPTVGLGTAGLSLSGSW
jgi:hypothetical protein